MQFNFFGKVILVTGGSRGLGRAIALQFAEAGGRVVIHYHQNRDAAEQTLSELYGNDHLLVQADLKNPDEIQHMVGMVINHWGRVDILVNNAGIFDTRNIIDMAYDEWQLWWQETMDTNLTGVANLSFCVMKSMIEHGGGKMINISSRGAFRGEPDAPAYGASKAGLNSLSQSLAKALASHGIFVYAIAPGFIETDMVAPYLNGIDGESLLRQSPLNRAAQPDEIACIVLFLAAEGTEYMTGCIIDANGASYLRT